MTLTMEATGAENVRWDLSDLYAGIDAPEIEADIQDLKQRSEQFAQNYRGRVAELSAESLLEAIIEYEKIVEGVARLTSFAQLQWTTDTLNEDYKRILSRLERFESDIDKLLVFFELEWQKAPASADELANSPILGKYHHYLKLSRRRAPYSLGEKEEQIISELTLTSERAWNRFYGEVMSKARYYFEGKKLNQSEILNLIRAPERAVRQKAADSFTDGLKQLTHSTTTVFNVLAQYKASIDKMRGYPTWISSRNLDNQTDDATVEALINAVTSRYDIVSRYYRLVQKLLGYETLYDYDRYAPILDSEWKIDWYEAQNVIMEAYDHFDPRMAEITAHFFENRWIDAPPAPNKRGGAYSSRAVTTAHPYIFMNYMGTADSVMTLAHELGHGVHQYLSRQQGHLLSNTPLTTSEMASTFGEMLVFESLMKRLDDPKERLALRLSKVSDTFATVFRQISMNRFEERLHNTIRQEGELTTDQISSLWLETQRPMFGDSVVLRDDYRFWWSYIPHFLSVPGYVYAYAFGDLLVWALYARYQAEGGDFSERYLKVLSMGGAVYPDELLEPLNVNLKDAHFWHEGLTLIEDMVIQAENEAAALE
jgi:oligoendopeptidase F